MSGEVGDDEKMRRLPWSLAFSATSSVFGSLTYFGPVFVLFLGELGLSKTGIGFLLSLLPFAGPISLIIASAVARIGVKRVFITFYTSRKFITAGLLLTPWISANHGIHTAFLFVTILVGLFAICRAVAETAIYPWYQEIVPHSFRGRYQGLSHILSLLASASALAWASQVIEKVPGMERFLMLIEAGVVFGLVSALCATMVPGGAPVKEPNRAHFRSIRQALADRNLRLYLVGTGIVSTAVSACLTAFVPLLMKEQIGLTDGQILLLQVYGSVAGLLSAYLWGWAADRAGSKSVAVSSAYLMVPPALFYLMMPRHHPLSFLLAAVATMVMGVASAGRAVGDIRLLYVDVVPPTKRTEYMAVYYAWIGVIGGLGPVVAGMALDLLRNLKGSWSIISLDPYTPVLVACLPLLLVGALALSRVRTESEIRPGA